MIDPYVAKEYAVKGKLVEDADGIPAEVDRCPGTADGVPVFTDLNSQYAGCSFGQTVFQSADKV